ncbi:hypothetical protein, partial [Parageobacillus thermoglucosidasius]|uniref:hypothetical protein n=1 Tax=Parageobacillus thermoglucosidasius TaxID=1426 RepID=UPI00241CEA9E
FDPLTNHFVTLQFFFAQWNSLLSHTDIFTEALQYDNITDEQHSNSKNVVSTKISMYNLNITFTFYFAIHQRILSYQSGFVP